MWVAKHCPSNQLKAMAPAVLKVRPGYQITSCAPGVPNLVPHPPPPPPTDALVFRAQGLLGVLGVGGDGLPATDAAATAASGADHTSMMLRGFAYQAVGSLASRVPEALGADVDLAVAFFDGEQQQPAVHQQPVPPRCSMRVRWNCVGLCVCVT